MAVLIVCGVDENGHRDIIAVEPMTEESRSSYGVLFQNLKDRGLSTPKLIISDAHSGLVSAIRESFPGASGQRCKVHFMQEAFVQGVSTRKMEKLAPTAEFARKRAYDVIDSYAKRFPKAVQCLEDGLEILWLFMHSQCWMREKSHLPT